MTEMLQHLLPKITDCAINAGKIILSIYHDNYKFTQKSNNTPLTEADMASHHHIVNFLQTLTPAWPILSEESSIISWEQRRQWARYWLVDPLDGTKEFIQRNGEFTVNVALIDQGLPVLGVVYVPEKQLLYYAASGCGAFNQELGERATDLRVNPHQIGQSWKIVASRSHPSAQLEQLLARFDNYELINMGSSLKLCLVASGQAQLYPRFGLTSEWDTAAAQCIVEEAGGIVVDVNLQPLRYNQKESLLNPHFIAASCLADLKQLALDNNVTNVIG